MKEVWKDIKDYEGLYQVSSFGNVRSLDRIDCDGRKRKGRILKPHSAKRYLAVSLSKCSNVKKIRVHKLVAGYFIKKEKEGLVVNHIDENKHNNHIDNLEWCTQRQNVIHYYKMRKLSC